MRVDEMPLPQPQHTGRNPPIYTAHQAKIPPMVLTFLRVCLSWLRLLRVYGLVSEGGGEDVVGDSCPRQAMFKEN